MDEKNKNLLIRYLNGLVAIKHLVNSLPDPAHILEIFENNKSSSMKNWDFSLEVENPDLEDLEDCNRTIN